VFLYITLEETLNNSFRTVYATALQAKTANYQSACLVH